MKLKKNIALIAAMAIVATMFAACSSDEDKEETTTPTTTSVVETEAETEAQVETEAETEAETDADTEIEEENLEANPLASLAEAVINEETWPAMMEVTDATFINDFFLIDTSDESISELLIMQCPMSSNMTELIVVKAADAEAGKELLNARREKAINVDAFYPNDVETAGNSIVGAEGDYAYFIMSANSADDEAVLVEAIKSL